MLHLYDTSDRCPIVDEEGPQTFDFVLSAKGDKSLRRWQAFRNDHHVGESIRLANHLWRHKATLLSAYSTDSAEAFALACRALRRAIAWLLADAVTELNRREGQ